MNKAIAILGLSLAATSANAADILAAGALYGSPTQATAVCFIYNSGSSAVTLTGPTIYNPDGFSVTSTLDTCHVTPKLGAGRICQVTVNAINQPYSCRAVVAPQKDAVRGMLEVRDANGTPLQNVQLR